MLQCFEAEPLLHGRCNGAAGTCVVPGNDFKFQDQIRQYVQGIHVLPLSDQWYCHWIYLQILLHQRICIRYGITVVWINLESLPFWLKDKSVNNISLVASSVWRYYGNNMVLFIGAIMSVDSEMYEAAELDGANKFQQFIHIILPSIKTIVTLNVILSITGSLSAFDPPYVITKGGGGTATYFVLMDKIAHTNQQVGLASAMAVVLLLIIFAATILQKLFFKLVFRSSDADNEEYTRRKRLRRERRWKKEAV